MEKKSQNICKLLSEYGINIRKLDLNHFNDVGEMTKSEFAQAKQRAQLWNVNDRLHTLIKSIKSGSVI